MEVVIKKNYEDASKLAASLIADVIMKKPDAVLGFATGSTPLGTYKELVKLYRSKKIDFKYVITFNLDEYIGLPKTHNQSYYYFMLHNLFKYTNIKKENIHLPDGLAKNIEESCEIYELMIKKAGGIDIQLLGIGSNGHIAFNEPGSSLGSRTRIKTLTEKTIQDNSRFFKKKEDVPRYAITMGIGTIMEAKEIILLASGLNKADAIADAVEGPITSHVPASILQMHPKATVIIEKSASVKLIGKYPDNPQVYRPKL